MGVDGDLLLELAGGEVRMRRPFVYQTAEDGGRQEVEGRYVVRGRNAAAFEVGTYDRRRAPVIDPILSYSTYLGASSFDSGNGIAVGPDGSAYVTGETGSLNFPTNGQTFIQPDLSAGQVFVTKLDAAGSSFVYSTCLGEQGPMTGPGVDDTAYGVALDAAGAVYVRLNAATSRTVTVDYATVAGTASADSDFVPVSGTLTFAPGTERMEVAVPIVGDTSDEFDESFSFTLSNPSAGVSLLLPEVFVNILDDDAPPALSVTDVAVREGGGAKAAFAVRLSQASGKDVAVTYSTADGTAAAGTLRFAAGEAQKTFAVLVNDDRFKEPPESRDLLLSNPSGAALGGPSVVPLTITSDDSADGPSPVRESSFDTQFFVRQHYHDFLNREPDAAGLQFWTGEIDNCPDAQCREVKRINVSAAFFLSIEFQETGYLAYRTYKAAYGDATSPNAAGTVPVIRLQEFLPDSRRIGRNVQVGIGNWESQLEANKQAYMLEFVRRQRFADAFPVSLTAAQFADRLDRNAGGVLSQGERDQLVAELAAAPDQAQGRAAALRRVAEDADMREGEKNRAFVLMQYFGYLRRNPEDPQDADFRGWKFWLDKLDQFDGNYVRAEMVKAFLDSDEYRQRFGR